MRFKRYLFLTLILFLTIFSISFVSASENATYNQNTGELTTLSMSDIDSIDENLKTVNLDSVEETDDSSLGKVNEDEIDEIESDDCLDNNETQQLRSIDESTSVEVLSAGNDLEVDNESLIILGATIDEPVLGNNQYLNDGDATTERVMNAILECSRTGGGTVYLYGRTYSGTATADAPANTIVNITNVKVVGGSPNDPNQIATFDVNPTQMALSFRGDQNPRYYSGSGFNFTNVTFENLKSNGRMFSFCSGSLTDVVFNNLESYQHLFFLYGCYVDSQPINLTNCNFTNCRQTYAGANGISDGSGQLGAIFGAKLVGCNFINTSSANHGGAFCLSDEYTGGAERVASSLIDCNFINVTSRWFAVYIHGNYSGDSQHSGDSYISNPQVLDNCKFINCSSSAEYGGALGISHNNVIIRNSEFINNTGGEGAAIMVGGIEYGHDAFWGKNTEGNNMTIENCTFKNNVARIQGQSSTYVPNLTTTLTPSGNAGAVFVYGNNTKIINTVFENNTAANDGAAIYIHGWGTVIENSTLTGNSAVEGTIYIEGSNTKITNSTYVNNNAVSGAGVYIIGSNATITDSTFENNTATESGAAAYINGQNTVINNSEVNNNHAGVYGGGFYVIGSDCNVMNLTSNNNTAMIGGAIAVAGDGAVFTDIVSLNNSATLMGGSTYVMGENTLFENGNFSYNTAPLGGAITVVGSDTTFLNNNVTYNKAEPSEDWDLYCDGGAICIEGERTNFTNNNISHNSARDHGGGVYVSGSDTYFENIIADDNNALNGGFAQLEGATNLIVKNSSFTNNHALGDLDNLQGEGGAFHIEGSENADIQGYFFNNTAINGSAIYVVDSSLYIHDSDFIENQAITHELAIYPENDTDFKEEDEMIITITHIGGDNIANAIHDYQRSSTIIVNNITYPFYHDGNETIMRTPAENVTPVYGWENSQNGTVIYEDEQENNQVIYYFVRNRLTGEYIIENASQRTDIDGTIFLNLTGMLPVGFYEVVGTYIETPYYTAAYNFTALFGVEGLNLTINKTVDQSPVYVNDTVVFTINVTNHGPYNATNVTVNDIVPSQFNVTGCNDTAYNMTTGVLIIPQLNVNASYAFTITAVALVVGTWTNNATANCKENETIVWDDATVVVLPLTDINVTKIWNDADNQDGLRPKNITVILLAGEVEINSTVLSDDNNWTYIFTDLPVTTKNGTVIVYDIKEIKVNNYTVTVTRNNYTFIINNTHNPLLTNINVTKVWDDEDNKDGYRPTNITIVLLSDGIEINRTVLSNSTGWNYTFVDLPVFNNGTPINYTIDEFTVENYTVVINKIANYTFVINNTHVPDVTNITVVKVWTDNNNQDGIRPVNITVQLLADGKVINTTVLSNETGWNYTWQNLSVYNNGVLIIYTVNETAVANYTVNITSPGNYRFVINNTHVPDVTNVTVVKVWTDNSNQDGVRPVNITVQLLADGVVINTTVLSNVTGWNYTWYDLPVYNSTKLINYTVNETIVANYTVNITSPGNYRFVINNTHVPDVTNVTVVKVWTDNSNQDGVRPVNITVQLLADGVVINTTVLSNVTGWNYTWYDLPVNKENGTVIVYTVNETTVANYTVNITSPGNYRFVINNTHVPLVTNFTVVKVWTDNNNQDGVRPVNITVQLLADGKVINTTVLSNVTGWNYTWYDLPVYKENGTVIVYTVNETTVANYTVNITRNNGSFIINNTHVPLLTNVTVVKVWTDNNNQDGVRPVNITVQLLADGVIINATVLSNATGWNYTFVDLPVFNNGTPINYTIDEFTVENYTVVINKIANYTFVINNTHITDVTNVTVVKVWTDNNNQDGVRPVNITVQLLADGVVINTTVLSNVTGWNYTWYDLPVYNSTKLIKYTINETIDANYAVKITSQGNYRFVINNTHNPRLTNINVTKVWDDNSNQDGVRPVNITVQLLADGVVINTTVLSNVTGWNYTWYDLPVYNSTKLINYTVNETIVANYTVKITSPGNYSFIINNTHIPVVTNVTVVKIWNDGNNASGTRPANITVELFADGIKINEAILNASNNWMAIFAGLPVYNDSNLINYTIREFKLANHKVKIIKVDNYTFMIENTLLTVVNVTKIWNDGNNATGTRPANITVEFFADGVKINETVLNATNDWKYSFTDLLVYNGTKLINYTINEITVANYIVNITKYANGTIVIKNTLLTDINVTKVWDDNDNQDGKRPQNLTIYLFADGNLINTTVLSNVTGWNYTWYDLPVYKENGTEIIYSVYENVVANYTFRTIGNNYYFIIINTHNPLNTTVNVTKVWNDADNHDKVRPPSIIVVLLADGDYYANCTLSDDNNWTYVFEDLPAYNNTKLINYTVQEFNVTNYTVKIINLGNGTFIINNTHEIIVGLSINKTVDEPVVYVNETVVFTINVTNNGPSIATNVTVKDIVPPQFNVTDCNDTKYRNNQLVVGTLNPGQSYVFTITAVALVNGTWTNVANVTCAENGTVIEDNATVEVLVLPPPHKEANVTQTLFNKNVTYYLTIINDGDYDYTKNVTVYDLLPEGLEFLRRTGIENANIVVDTTINSKNNISWVITNISAHSIAVIEVEVRVHAIGNLTNNETIVYPDGTNMTVNCTIEVLPSVDVSVVKVVDASEHFVDDIVVWTITVSNAGNGSNATNVTLNDVLPANFTLINYTASVGNYTNGVWNIGFMGNGTSVTLTINSRATAVGNYTNYANVTCNEDEWNYENNFANESVVIYNTPDVNKTANVTQTHVYKYVDYNLTITNTGNVTYNKTLIVVDSLPYGLKYIRTVIITGARVVQNATVVGQNITWKITDIAPGATAVITVKVFAYDIGNLTNNGTLIGPNGTEKKVNETIEVLPYVDVSVVKVVDASEHFVDDIVVWTITVSNAGNGSNATNVTLNDVLPANFTLINYTASVGNYTNGVWNIGFMGNGTSVTLTINSRATAVGNYTNYANVTCNEDEWNYENNFANESVVIYNTPDVNKTANVTQTHVYKYVDYNLTITNTGNVTYNKTLIVVDSLPYGLKYIRTVIITGARVVQNATVVGQNITWKITDIAPGATAVITVKVFAYDIGNLTNNGTLIGPNGTEKKVNETIEVLPYVDVSVVKVVDASEHFVDDIVVWTITVSNAGNGSNATNVTLNDVLPANFTLINYTASVGNYTNGVWNIGFMGNGTSVTLTINSRATAVGNYTNYANVTCNEDEWNYENNFANESVVIYNTPDVNKTANVTQTHVYKYVDYNLTITNTGNVTYNKTLIVVDSLPYGLKYIRTVIITGARVVQNATVVGQNITWKITDIAPGATAVITVKVFAYDIGNLTNNGTLIGPNGTEKKVNETIEVLPYVDVSVVKVVDASEHFVDDIVVWTITVSNAGNGSNATNVTLNDVLPANFTLINYTASVGNYTNGVWNIGFMGNGTSVTLTINSRATAVGNYTNYANVTCNEDEWNYENNFANESVVISDIPDINKTANVTTVFIEENVLYYITITNVGNVDYTNTLTIVDSLPEGLEYLRTVGITGANIVQNANVTGQVITWKISNIKPGIPAVITVEAKASAVANLTNNATEIDPYGYNKTANCTVEVKPICDLEIFKSVNATSVYVNEFVEWTITVINHGPSAAADVVVKDTLPKGLKVVYTNPSVGKFNSKTGIWNIGDMDNNTSVSLVLVTQALKEGSITNIVVVNTTTNETNYTNNKANNTTVVKPICDLEITKVVNEDKVYVGETVVWTIKIKNNGPSTAKNVKVTDLLPKGLKVLNAKVSEGSFNMNSYVWTIKSLANGDSATLKLKTKVTREGFITNPASVKTTTKERDYTNNKANDTTEGIPIVDLELTKQSDKEVYSKGDKMYWTITVINHGPSTAKDVVVSDTLPSGVKFLSFKASKGTYDPTTGKWDIGELAKGETATIVIYCNVTAENGTITNYASVTCSIHDSNPDNNNDSATITVETQEHQPPKMHPTGNPIVMVVLSLLVLVGVSIKRKL